MYGEIFSSNIQKINYFEILKHNVYFQDKSENNNFYLSLLSKEISINNKEKISNNNKIENESNEEEKKEEDGIKEDINNENERKNSEEVQNVELIEKENSIPAVTTVIQANNIAENYNTTYKSVKIKNETKYNLSQEMLIPDVEFSDKKNIIVFHTHTCESYTQTKENSYNPSRKLQNNGFRLFSCKSR